MMRWEKSTCLMLPRTRLRKRFSSLLEYRTAFGRTTRACSTPRPHDLTFQRPSAPCTTRAYPDPASAPRGSLGLSVINDVVTREAFSRDLSLIDLRGDVRWRTRTSPDPIEPSVQGGYEAVARRHSIGVRIHVVARRE